MTDVDYQALASALDDGGPLLQRHAEQTENNLEGLERKWIRYVNLMGTVDTKE